MPHHSLRDPGKLQALLDAVLSIGSGLELEGVLARIVDSARMLTGARYAALGVIDASGKGLEAFIHAGLDDETVARIGHEPEGSGILGLLILEPHPIRLADLSTHPDSVGFPPGHPPMRSFLGVPLLVRGEAYGNLYLTEKQGAPEFSEEDLALSEALAAAAGIAVDNARMHARLGELSLAADRERIARDLHDTVIQRLFATGLSIQSALPLADEGELRTRLEWAVNELDETIRQVRTTIFALEPPRTAEKGVRSRLLEICAESARSLGFEPEVRFQGAIDSRVGKAVSAELFSSLREALANVARHAQAHRVEVEVVVDDHLTLRVIDDGRGPATTGVAEGNGLSNMAQRARALGGSFSLSVGTGEPAPGRGPGAVATWQVPLGH